MVVFNGRLCVLAGAALEWSYQYGNCSDLKVTQFTPEPYLFYRLRLPSLGGFDCMLMGCVCAVQVLSRGVMFMLWLGCCEVPANATWDAICLFMQTIIAQSTVCLLGGGGYHFSR